MHLKSEPEANTEVSHLWRWSSLSPRGIQVGGHQGALQRRLNTDVDEYLTIATSNIRCKFYSSSVIPSVCIRKAQWWLRLYIVVESQDICLIAIWAE